MFLMNPLGLGPDTKLDLWQAAECREADGSRRFGSVHTLRRRVKDGSLPFTLEHGRYRVHLSDLETLESKASSDPTEAARAELKIAAQRVLATSGPLSDEECERLAATLRGGAAL